MKLALPSLLLALLLSGCSTTPEALRDAPQQSPSLREVQENPASYRGIALSWGGTIVSVENLPLYSRIEIIARELDKHGEPRETDHSGGRFIAQVEGFLDPEIYSSGRTITVVGKFIRVDERQLDQMRYRYPLVAVSAYHLWPVPEPVPDHYDPYWDDPFLYDPWYPFGYPYPYRYPWPYY
jgi:outer membrane lipoprotein